eukprot:sb/3478530/
MLTIFGTGFLKREIFCLFVCCKKSHILSVCRAFRERAKSTTNVHFPSSFSSFLPYKGRTIFGHHVICVMFNICIASLDYYNQREKERFYNKPHRFTVNNV